MELEVTSMKNKGFTLIELLIGLAIFSMIILSMTAIAASVIKSQRKAFSLQNVQEASRYILEAMSKEIRMSTINSGDGSSSTLDITNSAGETVEYRFEGGAERIQRRISGGFWQDVNPANLEVTGRFYVDKIAFPARSVVTVVMKINSKGAKAEEQAEIYLQSTITPRPY